MSPAPATTADSTETSVSTGIALVLLTLLGWSSIPLFLEHFSHLIDAWTSNGWRYGFSALLWAPVLLVAVVRRRTPARLWAMALAPSLFNAAGQVCFTWAHYKIEPGLLTFGLRSQILFVAIGAYLLFPTERKVIRSPWYIAGAVAVLAGVCGAVALGEGTLTGGHLAGVLLAIASGMLFAGYALAVRRFMAGVNSIIAFAAISQYTAAAMVLLMLIAGDEAGLTAARMPAAQIMWLLISAVIGIALGHVMYYMSIARLGVAVTSGVIQLQPFAAAVGSYFLYHEVLTVGQWVSGGAAVAGATLMLSVQWRLSRAAARAKATAKSAAARVAAPTVVAVDPTVATDGLRPDGGGGADGAGREGRAAAPALATAGGNGALPTDAETTDPGDPGSQPGRGFKEASCPGTR